jgi:hypothetical protein
MCLHKKIAKDRYNWEEFSFCFVYHGTRSVSDRTIDATTLVAIDNGRIRTDKTNISELNEISGHE